MKKILIFSGIWDLGFGIWSESATHDLGNLRGGGF